jgi:hypothetical protein
MRGALVVRQGRRLPATRALFDAAYRGHARRLARAIIWQQGNADPEQQEV